ncbi:YIPF1-like protein, partial [Trifolium medium]|nr:YIPF1-like protein [Trifolium medium]
TGGVHTIVEVNVNDRRAIKEMSCSGLGEGPFHVLEPGHPTHKGHVDRLALSITPPSDNTCHNCMGQKNILAPLCERFGRLFDFAETKSCSVAEMFSLGWGADGEAWVWRRQLRAWEEEMLGGVSDFTF